MYIQSHRNYTKCPDKYNDNDRLKVLNNRMTKLESDVNQIKDTTTEILNILKFGPLSEARINAEENFYEKAKVNDANNINDKINIANK